MGEPGNEAIGPLLMESVFQSIINLSSDGTY